MKSSDLTKEQKEELEKFGANTWFVEYLHKQYEEDPSEVSEQWQNFFGKVTTKENGKGNKEKNVKEIYQPVREDIPMPIPGEEDRVQIIAGSSAKILDNMSNSLSIPVATSQRTIPVKLLEENRTLINHYLQKKISVKFLSLI